MTEALVAFVLALWSAIAPGLERTGDAAAIARALVGAVLEDAATAPVYSSHLEDLAAGAYWAFRESSLDARAVGDHSLAHGPWQLHGAAGLAPVREQARTWLALLHEGAARCTEHPAAIMWGACSGDVVTPAREGAVTLRIEKLAAKRERLVRELTRRALAAL